MSNKLTHGLKYHHRLRVTWRGRFPLDMLRHDVAYPYTGHDAWAIEASFESHGGPHTAVVATYSERNICPWTHGRWASFMCTTEEI